MLNLNLLTQICQTPGPSGFEKPIRDLLLRELRTLEGFIDPPHIDHLGNLIITIPGTNPDQSIAVAAHLDEIGFIISHIDDQGFLRFNPLGGFDPKTLSNQRVIVHGRKPLPGVMGSKPIHIMTPEERNKAPKLTDYYIDLGLPAKDVKKLVQIGDPVTRDRELIQMGDCLNTKSLDNRISVYILLETLNKLHQNQQKPSCTLHALFTVQEEVGLRGARAAALALQPDFGLGLDVTIANDTPGAKPEQRCTSLGQGTAIKIMDNSTICDPRMVRYLKNLASKHHIPWQAEIMAGGGTDTAGLQLFSAGGSIAGALSIPTRNLHQVIEMAHQKDIQATIDLLTLALTNLNQHNWTH